MKDKELKQKLSRIQSKAFNLQFDIQRLLAELDIENNQSQETKEPCLNLHTSKSPDTNVKQSTKSEILKDYE